MSGPYPATGPCLHGVIDDVCDQCTVDFLWREVVVERPTRGVKGKRAEQAFGFRGYLGQAAMCHRPLRYLEIGVRRGHSLALVLAAATVNGELDYAVGVDSWIANYAGEPNEGPDDVRAFLEQQVGPAAGKVQLMTGDSHELLPGLGRAAPRFNLILVDGDHTPPGAAQDLEDAFELLEPGGELVFDDAVYQGDNALLRVWRQFINLSNARPQIAESGEQLKDSPAWCWLRKKGADASA